MNNSDCRLTITGPLHVLTVSSQPYPQNDQAADECEHCQQCGRGYTDVYWLPDDIWEQITPKPDTPGAGLLCPGCALANIIKAGLLLSAAVRAVLDAADARERHKAPRHQLTDEWWEEAVRLDNALDAAVRARREATT